MASDILEAWLDEGPNVSPQFVAIDIDKIFASNVPGVTCAPDATNIVAQ